jgi:hypothetical protein
MGSFDRSIGLDRTLPHGNNSQVRSIDRQHRGSERRRLRVGDGRKRPAGSVLLDAHGRVLAVARTLWVTISRPERAL